MAEVKCEMCGSAAYALVQWGLKLPEQRANLCEVHVKEVWDRCGHAANGIWTQGPPVKG